MPRTEQNIRILRERTGLSQERFAQYFGIPMTTYSKWEQGVRRPPQYLYDLIERYIQDHPMSPLWRPDQGLVRVELITAGELPDHLLLAERPIGPISAEAYGYLIAAELPTLQYVRLLEDTVRWKEYSVIKLSPNS